MASSSSMHTPGGYVSYMTEAKLQTLQEWYPPLSQFVPTVPAAEQRADTPPKGMISVYEVAISQGNLRFPLTRFFRSVCEYYNIAIAQLHPNAINKIMLFEMYCNAISQPPLLNVFRMCNSLVLYDVGWFSFRSKLGVMTSPKDSIGNWRSSFFYTNDTAYVNNKIPKTWCTELNPDVNERPVLDDLENDTLKILKNAAVALDLVMRSADISRISPARRLKNGDGNIILIDEPIINTCFIIGGEDRGKRKVADTTPTPRKKRLRTHSEQEARSSAEATPLYNIRGRIPTDVLNEPGNEDLSLPSDAEASNEEEERETTTEETAAADRAFKLYQKLYKFVPAETREQYRKLSYPAAARQRLHNCYNAIYLTVDSMERFTEMSDEYEKATKAANAQERRARKAESRLEKVMEENARLKRRAEVAEHEFAQLVKYLPTFADKVMDSEPVTEKFQTYAQASKLATRCEWHDLLCQLGDLSQPLPSDMAKEIIATDDAREILERAKKEVEKINIPVLEELSQREGVTFADIKALEF
ncbi:uncharacterized protein [Rutidosis leptorrhynchoides]|uniref:uncharacterized protein n=1 Tax=Rutidosis leptorrhynchoides TaxID=125765 RepID=UPI003A9A1B38